MASKLVRKWRRRLPFWTASFLLGAFLRWWLGVAHLLILLLSASVLVAFLRVSGVRKAYKAERGLLDYFWNTIRGMVLFAMLPIVWASAWSVYTSRWSSDSVLQLSVIVGAAALVWVVLGSLPRRWGVGSGPRRVARKRRKVRT